MSFTFKKDERLKSRKTIGLLFSEGSSFFIYPYRVFWIPLDKTKSKITSSPIQATFSVSKRKFKHAVVRNKLKRRMKEAYRLNKRYLYDNIPENKHFAIMFVYTQNKILEYKVIEHGMKESLAAIIKKIN